MQDKCALTEDADESEANPRGRRAFIALEPAASLVASCWDVELELGEGVLLRLTRG